MNVPIPECAATQLAADGFEINAEAAADVVLFNTCSVRKAEHKIRHESRAGAHPAKTADRRDSCVARLKAKRQKARALISSSARKAVGRVSRDRGGFHA